ncbi:hypothetical protein [Primorskyibacter sp. S187A]|uniref:hypothetical protein n=1 Tax=Primorskyibacter sp. S187A TaxID=3415130 RepID=UPI003C7C7D84
MSLFLVALYSAVQAVLVYLIFRFGIKQTPELSPVFGILLTFGIIYLIVNATLTFIIGAQVRSAIAAAGDTADLAQIAAEFNASGPWALLNHWLTEYVTLALLTLLTAWVMSRLVETVDGHPVAFRAALIANIGMQLIILLIGSGLALGLVSLSPAL